MQNIAEFTCYDVSDMIKLSFKAADLAIHRGPLERSKLVVYQPVNDIWKGRNRVHLIVSNADESFPKTS